MKKVKIHKLDVEYLGKKYSQYRCEYSDGSPVMTMCFESVAKAKKWINDNNLKLA